jgi:hypothetical protein
MPTQTSPTQRVRMRLGSAAAAVRPGDQLEQVSVRIVQVDAAPAVPVLIPRQRERLPQSGGIIGRHLNPTIVAVRVDANERTDPGHTG